MAELFLKQISKEFDNGVTAVSELDLSVAGGELMVFVGPSGCGKSTLLRIIAGLESPTSGIVEIDGTKVNDMSPAKRNVAMVFQNYALYPHMTVRRNMELSLRLRHVPKAERRRVVGDAAAMLGLSDLLERRPAQLSGGQRQRVAMGRALVRDPSVFLLDEPLSNLDAKLRAQMRIEIRQLQRRLATTMIFVTHDQVEAMTMADRIAIMRQGVLQQVGTPQEIYDRPANLFVADFIGSPPINLMHARTVMNEGRVVLEYGSGQTYRLPNLDPAELVSSAVRDGANAIVGIRPEDLVLDPDNSWDDAIPGKVVLIEPLGGETLVHIEIPAKRVVTAELRDIAIDVDRTTLEDLEVGEFSRFVAKAPTSLSIVLGQAVRVRPRPEATVHFFDPEGSSSPATSIAGRANALTNAHSRSAT